MSESGRLYRWDIAPEQFGVVIKHSLNNTATYYGPGHDIEIPVDIADEILSLASELESLRQELARKDEALRRLSNDSCDFLDQACVDLRRTAFLDANHDLIIRCRRSIQASYEALRGEVCQRCGGSRKLLIEGMPIKQCPDCALSPQADKEGE